MQNIKLCITDSTLKYRTYNTLHSPVRFNDLYDLYDHNTLMLHYYYSEAVPYIMKQLQLLWAPKTVSLLFVDMIQFAESKDRVVTADDQKKSGKAAAHL